MTMQLCYEVAATEGQWTVLAVLHNNIQYIVLSQVQTKAVSNLPGLADRKLPNKDNSVE